MWHIICSPTWMEPVCKTLPAHCSVGFYWGHQGPQEYNKTSVHPQLHTSMSYINVHTSMSAQQSTVHTQHTHSTQTYSQQKGCIRC